MSEQPKITTELPACAAIRMPDGVTFAGLRHHSCLMMINYAWGGNCPFPKGDWEQGFMTTRGQFVNRREALMMRLKEGLPSASIDGRGYRGNELYSEDLY